MRQLPIALILGLITGGFLGYKYAPTKTIEVPTIKEVTKVQVETITKTIKGKDGVEKTITKVIDNSVIQRDSKPLQEKPNYFVLVSNRQNNVKSLILGRRLVGNMFITGGIDTEKQLSLGILIEF